jgi:hypothetical protein
LSDVHDVFHVSQLKKCLRVPEEQILIEDLDAKEDLSYQSTPSKILKHLRELPGTRGSRCARCSEAIMPRKKLLRKEKKS